MKTEASVFSLTKKKIFRKQRTNETQ